MIHSLQLLRFFAASIVVLLHARVPIDVLNGTTYWKPLHFGGVGVDIFFVISGFIMMYTFSRHPIHPLHFFGKRFLRLWPLYAIATLFAAFMVFNYPLYYYGWAHWPHIVKSMFFIPDLRPNNGGIAPLIAPGWTLNLEMVFYLIFAISLFFKRYALVSGVLLVGFFLLSFALKETAIPFKSYASEGGIILEFLLGYLLFYAYIKKVQFPTWLAGILMVASFAWMCVFFHEGKATRLLDAGIPAFIMCLSALQFEDWFKARSARFLSIVDFLGRLTYALYILHNFLVQSIYRYFQHLERTYDHPFMDTVWFGYLYFVIVFIAAVGVSALSYLLIEKPATRASYKALGKIFDKRSKSIPA